MNYNDDRFTTYNGVPPRQSASVRRGRKRHGLWRGASRSTRRVKPGRRMSMADVRRMRRRVIVLLCVLLAAESVVAAFTSPALWIREVRVNGIEPLLEPESTAVLHTVRVVPGTNWLRMPSAPMAAHLMAMPWVAHAAVEKRFPDRIEVRLVAREPVAVVESGQQLVEVDAGAVPIRPARPEMARTLPHVVIPAGTELAFGSQIPNDGVRAALGVLHDMAGDITVRIAKIEVDQSDNLCLNMGDNTPIRLGQMEDLDVKLGQVRRICRSRPDLAKFFTEIDLTCPARPACTLRSAPPSTVAVSRSAPAAGLTQ